MKNIKYYSLICFFILFSFSSVSFNISAQEENNDLLEAKHALKFESAIKRAKKSVVLLAMSANVDPETDPSKSGMCSGVVINDIGHVLTNFHCVHNNNYIRLYYYDENDWQNYEVKVVGSDPLADLALLEVIDKEEPIPYLTFADDIKNVEEGCFIRYSLISNYCLKKKIKYLITAHHQDDQIENFFIRLLRGSGLSGLASMPVKTKYNNRLKIIRPFLNLKKTDLKYVTLNYFKTYIKDLSNKNKKFS